MLATFFFLGFTPKLPGTVGSLGGIVLLYFLPQNPVAYATSVFILFLIASWATSKYLAKIQKRIPFEEDPSEVVIDEVMGILVTFFALPRLLWILPMGFVLFRGYDILKPFPIRWVESWRIPWGILADDVLAGIYSNLSLRLILLLWS